MVNSPRAMTEKVGSLLFSILYKPEIRSRSWAFLSVAGSGFLNLAFFTAHAFEAKAKQNFELSVRAGAAGSRSDSKPYNYNHI